MTARQVPKYPFRPKADKPTWSGGYLLTLIPLSVLLAALVVGIFWSAWRASFCSL